jgi:hypothetical protein
MQNASDRLRPQEYKDWEPRGRRWRPGMKVCMRVATPEGNERWYDAIASAVTALGVEFVRDDGKDWPDDGGPVGVSVEIDTWVLEESVRNGTTVILDDEPLVAAIQKAAVICYTTLAENGFSPGGIWPGAENIANSGSADLFHGDPDDDNEVIIQVYAADTEEPVPPSTGMILLQEAWVLLRSWEDHIAGSPAEQVGMIEDGLRQLLTACEALFNHA